MMTLVMVAVLAADAAPAHDRPKLIVLDLTAGAGVTTAETGPLSEALTAQLASRGFFDVVSQRDAQTLLGLEREKQLLGCTEEAQSCVAEVSGALGARFALQGSLVKLGELYQLTLAGLDTTKTKPLGRAVRLAKDLGLLQAQLPWAIAEATAIPPPEPPSKVLSLSLMGGGAGALVFGIAFGISTLTDEARLRGELDSAGPLGDRAGVLRSLADYQRQADSLTVNKWISAGALTLGAAALATGILLFPSNDGSTRIALVPTAHGAALVGIFP